MMPSMTTQGSGSADETGESSISRPRTTRDFGLNRAARRRGSNPAVGGSNADEHVQDLAGSSALWIYLRSTTRLKGAEELKQLVESFGCAIGFANDAPVDPGKGYQQLKVVAPGGALLPPTVLKEAHRWAHRHNLLHSFYKPGYGASI